MSYSINGKIPNPNIVRFLTDRPAIMDRYDDVAILRQNLLNHQRVKIPPNEQIIKKLKKKGSKKKRRSKNLRGELSQIRTQQRRFEKGEKRDKPEQEPTIVGDPVQQAGGGGIAFDPAIEREKIQAQLQIAQGKDNVELQRIAVAAAQLDLNRELQRRQERESARERALAGRRLGLEDDRARVAAAQEDQRIGQEDERIRLLLERHRAEDERYRDLIIERENERERDELNKQIDLAEQRRVRREAVAEDRRRQAAEQAARQQEVEAQIQGQIQGQTIRRSAEIEQLEERNQFELARGQQEREDRAEIEEARRLQLEALERRREEQFDILREESRLNRESLNSRLNEVDREREQRQQQREADFLQRGLHEVDDLITRRLSEAEDRLRTNIPDPIPEREPQVIVLQPPPQPSQPPPERPDLSAEIAETIRQQLSGVRAPETPVRSQSSQTTTPQSPAIRASSGRRVSIDLEPTDLTASQLDRQFEGDTQAAAEQTSEEARVATEGIQDLTESTVLVDREIETDPLSQGGTGVIEGVTNLVAGGRDLFNQGLEAYDQYSRDRDVGQQTGGQLRTGTGELVLGLGQEIEESTDEEEESPRRVPFVPPVLEPEPQQEDTTTTGKKERTTQFRGREVPADLTERFQPPSRQVSPVRERPISPTQQVLIEQAQGASGGAPRPTIVKETELQKASREYKESVKAVGAVKRYKTREPKFPGEIVAPQRAAEYKRLGGDRAVERLQKESDRKKQYLESVERNIKFGLADKTGKFTGKESIKVNPQQPERKRVRSIRVDPKSSKIEEVEEATPRGASPLVGEGLLEETEGQGVAPSQVRDNYVEYQGLKTELDTFKGAGGARTRGGGRGSRGIPFTITNISNRNLKKLGPGETVNIQSVLGNDNIRYFTQQTRGGDPTNLSKSELDRLLREGKIRISRIR